MAAGKYNFVIEQGSTVDFEIQYNDSNGSPVDLTDYTARMQIRSSYGSSGPLHASLTSTLDSDGSGLNLKGSNGVKPRTSGSIGLVISSEKTTTFDFGTAKYDLELVKNTIEGSYVIRLLEGRIKLNKNVTV